MAKYLAQIVFLSAQVVGRAFSRALRQELAASQSAANQRRTNTGTNDRGINLKIGLNLEEAMQILNLRHQELNPEVIESNYKHLFEINDKSKGGSFYLQSKVFRAKERVEEELQRMYSTSDRKTQKKDPFPD